MRHWRSESTMRSAGICRPFSNKLIRVTKPNRPSNPLNAHRHPLRRRRLARSRPAAGGGGPRPRPESSISAGSPPRRMGPRRAIRARDAVSDAVIVRTMPPGSLEQVVFRMDRPAPPDGRSGVRVLNPPRAPGSRAWTSTSTTARLEAAGLPCRRRSSASTADAALEAFDAARRRRRRQAALRLGGPRHGARHDPETGVADVPRRSSGRSSVLYLQQFIRHPGWDLRVFVLGGRVLAAMRRHRQRRLADQRRAGRHGGGRGR